MSEEFAVQFRNVTKRFGTRSVLNEVSFQIPVGHALCILGRSGTGKSVSLKLLIGLMKPDSGVVLIQNQNITQLDEKELSKVRRQMGFLFQSAALFDSFTLADNLAVPYAHFEKSKSKSEVKKLVQERLSQVGLERDAGKKPKDLSGGMRKRAGLARAMILDPKVLLVDEPSSGLDRITASEIDDLLCKVKKEAKTTMVVVTHDIREARRLADKVLVLDEGRAVGYGTLQELESTENEIVRRLISET